MLKKIVIAVFAILFMKVTVFAADSFDPCDLLSKEEAATLAGEPVNTPELQKNHNPLGQRICVYNTESSSRLMQISVIRTDDISPAIRKHGQTAGKIYTTTKEMLAPQESVPGIGDDAFWGTPGLHILKDEIYVMVSVGNTSDRENLELARRIALKVMSRLFAR